MHSIFIILLHRVFDRQYFRKFAAFTLAHLMSFTLTRCVLCTILSVRQATGDFGLRCLAELHIVATATNVLIALRYRRVSQIIEAEVLNETRFIN